MLPSPFIKRVTVYPCLEPRLRSKRTDAQKGRREGEVSRGTTPEKRLTLGLGVFRIRQTVGRFVFL